MKAAHDLIGDVGLQTTARYLRSDAPAEQAAVGRPAGAFAARGWMEC